MKELQICVGARIMLIYYVDIADGLAHCAFGTVTKLVYGQSATASEVKLIEVSFDNQSVGKRRGKKVNNEIRVFIERVEELVGKDSNFVRKQFPVKLAWAYSVHKVCLKLLCH